jgi:NADPH2:quinone reductase
MTHAVRIHQTGGPEALVYEEVALGDPGAGEVRLRQTAIGLNFIDTYHRSGLYPVAELPAVLGREAAGVIEAVGPGVTEFEPGDRVAYPLSAGAYAAERLIKAEEIVRLPDSIEARRAAAMMLKGLTARYLLRRTYRVKPGDTILVHAAAGGVGSILCQWATWLGATVIGTVGTEEKAELAREHGCEHPIVYREGRFADEVKAITKGKGVPVVYDSVGRETFDESLDCLAPLGLMVSYGNASGPVEPLAIGKLAAKGSLFLTRPTLATYIARREDLVRAADDLFDVVAEGAVRVEVRQTYPLAETERAHRDLEARRTTGSTVLIP